MLPFINNSIHFFSQESVLFDWRPAPHTRKKKCEKAKDQEAKGDYICLHSDNNAACKAVRPWEAIQWPDSRYWGLTGHCVLASSSDKTLDYWNKEIILKISMTKKTWRTPESFIYIRTNLDIGHKKFSIKKEYMYLIGTHL